MHSTDMMLPPLEINLKKFKPILHKKKKNIKHILVSPLHQMNKLKAYSFFNSIKAKTNNQMEEMINKDNQKNSLENKKNEISNKSDNNKFKEKSINNSNQIHITIKKYALLDNKYYNYTPGNEDYLVKKFFNRNNKSFKSIVNNNLKIRNELKAQKEKEILYQKNIENKYNNNILN